MDLPSLSLTSWAGIAAAAAMLGGAWVRVFGVIRWVSGFVICRISIKDEAARAVMAAVWLKGRRSPFGTRIFGGARAYVQPKKRIEVVGFETVSQTPMLFWFGRVPVLVCCGNGGQDVNTYNGEIGVVQLSFIRGMLDVDAFVERALDAFNQLTAARANGTATPRKRFNVYRISRARNGEQSNGRVEKEDIKSGNYATPSASPSSDDILKRLMHNELRLITWTPSDLIERSNDQPPFDLYPYPADPLSVLPEIETWIRHESWFREKGVPWRRGYLATGQPGTGKSTFVRSVAIRYDLPLYVFDLASMDNQSFISEWRQVQQNTPAIVLLEDLDTIYKGRTFCATVSQNRDTLTFDCLLNTISGVGSSDGILLFITTNHVDSLDPALGAPVNGHGRSSRPGRIDRVIHFGPMAAPERRKLAQFILADYPDQIESVVAAGEGETAAQFQERCAQTALAHFWERGVKGEVEPPTTRVPETEIERKRRLKLKAERQAQLDGINATLRLPIR